MLQRPPTNLAELLHPVTPEQFFDEIWGHTHQLVTGSADRFAGLISLDGLIPLLRALPARLPHVSLLRDGLEDSDLAVRLMDALRAEDFDGEKLVHLCGDATLVVNRGQHRQPAITQLARMLFSEFNEWVTANIYLSPPGGSEGLGFHYDCWEIFVLQIEGAKDWELFPTRADRPVEKVDFGAPRAPAEEPSLKVTLAPGDLLYMPRGTWHSPHPADAHSLHLTVGVHCATGLELANWIWHELSRDAEARGDLPLHRAGQPEPPELPATFEQGLARIRALISAPDALARFLTHRFEYETSMMYPKPGPDGDDRD